MSSVIKRTPNDDELSNEYQYRELSWPAVCSLVFGLGTLASFPFAMIGNPTLPGAILYGAMPAVGIFAGLRALVAIARDPAELTGRNFARGGMALSAVFAAAGWAYMSYIYNTEVPADHQRIHYELLQPEGTMLSVPESARALDGKKVFIKGYMYPPPGGQQIGIRQFILCRDNGDCCFGGTPKITDMIFVRLKGASAIEFSSSIHKLAGTFRIHASPALHELGTVLYHLDEAELR